MPFKSVLLRGSPQGSWCVQCPQEGLVLGNVIQHFEVWLRTIREVYTSNTISSSRSDIIDDKQQSS